MPYIDATLAWAIPVPIETLGAHVEAYLNLLPAITTLRLCHRFRPDSGVARLPVELLVYIEELLTRLERVKTTNDWAQDFKCAQYLCEPRDHLTDEQFQSFKTRFCARDPRVRKDDDEHAIRILNGQPSFWYETHDERRANFANRLMNKTRGPFDFFEGSSELLQRNFGLDMWRSFVRLNGYPVDNFWKRTLPEAPNPIETVISYLVLPGTHNHLNATTVHDEDIPEENAQIEDGCALDVMPPSLTKSARKRFDRAMKILDLTPTIHPSQKGRVIGAPRAAGKEEPGSWPRLTMLIQTGVFWDP